MKRLFSIVLIVGAAFIATTFLKPSSEAIEYSGQPYIIDGDTIKINGERIRCSATIRLSGTDTCEMGQPATLAGSSLDCGAWARQRLIELVGPRQVRCESTERDKYDRALATCYIGKRDLNAAIVRNGIGFAYGRSTEYLKLLRNRSG